MVASQTEHYEQGALMQVGGNQYFYHDHSAIAAGKGNGRAVCALLQNFFGFEPNYAPGIIGESETRMWTVDMRRDGVQVAVMEGEGDYCRGGRLFRSQISLWEDGKQHGPMTVQHMAISCRDIRALAEALAVRGIRFLTESERGAPHILVGKDGVEGEVLQVFTYPIVNGFFFEFKQKVGVYGASGFKEFRDDNVRGLWHFVRLKTEEVGENDFFSMNIFGEFCSLTESLCARRVTHFLGEPIRQPIFKR